jgi:hypothetical protein
MKEYTLKRKFGGRSKDGGEIMFIVYSIQSQRPIRSNYWYNCSSHFKFKHNNTFGRVLPDIREDFELRRYAAWPRKSAAFSFTVTHASISPLPACLPAGYSRRKAVTQAEQVNAGSTIAWLRGGGDLPKRVSHDVYFLR